MFFVFLIKNMCLLAYYFSIAVLFLINNEPKAMLPAYFVILVSLSISYFINLKKESSKLRYLPIISILICFAFVKNVPSILTLIFPEVYMIFIIKNKNYCVDYSVFGDLFIKLVISIAVFLLILLSFGFLDEFKVFSLAYTIVFLISGVYLLRTIRHSREIISNPVFCIANTIIIILTFLICIALSSDVVLNSIIHILKLIYSNAIAPILTGMLYAFYGIAWILSKLMILITKNYSLNETELQQGNNVADQAQKAMENLDNNVNPLVFNIIMYALIIIVAILLLKKFLSMKNKDLDVDDNVEENRSFIDANDKICKKGKVKTSGTTGQVRHWYRKYLLLCKRKKVPLLLCDSSEVIMNKSNDKFNEAENDLNELRQIYIKARYSQCKPEIQDVKKVKTIYKKLENDKNSTNKV